MTITPYMLEAGVAAMARIKAKPCEDSAVVTTVFNAMLHAEAYEKKVRDRTATKPVYVHQDWPSWRYGPDGASMLCASVEEVPAGWSTIPGAAPDPPASDPDLLDARLAYQTKIGKKPFHGWTAAQLREKTNGEPAPV